MKTFKKVLALLLVVALTATAAVNLTLAYLQDQDEDVNVMTLGNVYIDQLEYERVVDEGGNWVSTNETDKYGYTPDELKEFAQAKPLYPAVFADGDIKWDDRNGSVAPSGDGSHQQSWGQVGAPGSKQLFDDSVKNVQDKFVFVENTGKSDAYVRTLIAFEQGDIAAENFKDVIMTSRDEDRWSWETVAADVEIDGNKYVVLCATYMGPTSNPTGILASGAVSYPSLLQVYMLPTATNEDVEAIDGNGNGTYDIRVLSQAIQTQGFADAKTALDTGFGPADAANVRAWFSDMKDPVLVNSADDLSNALNNGEDVILTDDVSTEATTTAPYGNKYGYKLDGGVLDGNGNELIIDCYGDDYGIMTSGGTIKNLTIKEGCRAVMIMYPTEDIILDNVNIGGDGVLYPINTGEAGAEGVDLIVTNSVLAGWTSYSNIESASFTNVEFKQGTYYNNIYGRVLKPYVNTTLTDCKFMEHMNLDLSGLAQGQKVTMENCTVNGQAVTEAVFTIPSTDEEYDTKLFTVDLPSWASSISDCIIFK